MKNKYFLIASMAFSVLISSCNGFLDQNPDKIFEDEQIYTSEAMIKSVLANFYGRVGMTVIKDENNNDKDEYFGQLIHKDLNEFNKVDEAVRFDNDNVDKFDRNLWRTYDYKLIRDINVFMKGVKESSAITEDNKKKLIAEARFLRAWNYFLTCRSLGGMPIVGDEVFDYNVGDDVTLMQKERATESEMYDYIINECNEVANILTADKTKNSARANKWTAKMLEARAALYAGSIAKYSGGDPLLQTPQRSLGIETEKAAGYFEKARAAAQEVIDGGKYILQDTKPTDKGRNFYEAVTVKSGNTEVIWARDFIYPGESHHFTKNNVPAVLRQEADCSYLSVLLNLVEDFEPIETNTPGEGGIKFETGTLDNPKFYDTPDAPFIARDPRLAGTVIYNGDYFTQEISFQAGALMKVGGRWEKKTASIPGGRYVDNDNKINILLTSLNGPIQNGERLLNKSGFCLRKMIDEALPDAATIRIGSDVWQPRFRISEAYMIVAEALVELGRSADALPFINAVRTRAGVKELTTVTFENIMHERRVEFAFEDQRYWDMKRWRQADKVWNRDVESAQRRGLYGYKVYAPGDPNHEKWYYEEVDMRFIYPNPLHFDRQNYYAELKNDWLNDNPKLEKNPLQ